MNAYPDLSPPDDIGLVGSTFSPGGKVLVVPLGDSLEFWDTATGTLRSRLITPEELQVIANPQGGIGPLLALDATGQTIYAASATGISIIKLPLPLDQMPPVTWPVNRNARRTPSQLPGAKGAHFHRPFAPRMAAMHYRDSSTTPKR